MGCGTSEEAAPRPPEVRELPGFPGIYVVVAYEGRGKIDVHVLETQHDRLPNRHIQILMHQQPITTRYKELKATDRPEQKGGIQFLRETKANDVPMHSLSSMQVVVMDSEVVYSNDLAKIGKDHGWPAGASLTYEMCKNTLKGISWNDAEQWIYYMFPTLGFVVKFDYDDDGFDSEIYCIKGFEMQGILVDTVHRNDSKRTHYFGAGMKPKNQVHAGIPVVQSAKLDDLPDRYLNNILFNVKRLTNAATVDLGQLFAQSGAQHND
eukprot:TRINITY_DN17149_c0_g1_i1.p1 TRINITY_DN17149_c0_g1~~TRINITY_DN17149_c0_g1_i1.p1  ORF type:complete len:265 (+),score=51.32 TRINITY_DN17149_c0_g1_i1:182-976(+)